MKMISDVREFHEAFSVPVLERPTVPGAERVALRLRLIREEYRELLEAMGERHEAATSNASCNTVDLVETADAIADLCYVLIGTAHEFGIPLDHVWDAVQASNMAKLGGKVREDGKLMKPEGWKPPAIREILIAHGWRPE